MKFNSELLREASRFERCRLEKTLEYSGFWKCRGAEVEYYAALSCWTCLTGNQKNEEGRDPNPKKNSRKQEGLGSPYKDYLDPPM